MMAPSEQPKDLPLENINEFKCKERRIFKILVQNVISLNQSETDTSISHMACMTTQALRTTEMKFMLKLYLEDLI